MRVNESNIDYTYTYEKFDDKKTDKILEEYNKIRLEKGGDHGSPFSEDENERRQLKLRDIKPRELELITERSAKVKESSMIEHTKVVFSNGKSISKPTEEIEFFTS